MSTRVSRREFLRCSAMAAAAATVVACVPTPTPTTAPSRPAAEPTKPAAQPSPTAQPKAAVPTAAASQAQPTAAQVKYREAPMLADLVKAGKLPPVEQRLPEKPRVIKPLEEIGQYGGVWRHAYKGVSDRWGPTKIVDEFLIRWDCPDPNTVKITASIVEKWQQNADASEFTFYLRKGMKWSDGVEVTTDATKFGGKTSRITRTFSPAGVGSSCRRGSATS